MSWDLRNSSVPVGDTDMYFVSFGNGKKNLILLPGLSDGLATVKGKARLLAKPYEMFFEKYTVYMFSRKNDMPDGYTIREMAEDQAVALKNLGIEKTSVLGVSQGGMIAQYLAIDHPELVEKLVLAVTAPKATEEAVENIGHWCRYAEACDHKSLMIDTAEKSYSEALLRKYRKLYPIIGRIGKPKNYRRFLVNARAILDFDATADIAGITCPTMIIGGAEDKIVGQDAAYDLHERIAGSELYIYENFGHAAYEEAKDFNRRVFDFLEGDPQ